MTNPKCFRKKLGVPALQVQSNFDLVTVNLKTTLDLVTFFGRPIFYVVKTVDLVTFWKILEP